MTTERGGGPPALIEGGGMGRGLPFVKGGRGGRAEAPPQNNTSGGDLGEPRGGAEGWETPPPPQILGLPPPPLNE